MFERSDAAGWMVMLEHGSPGEQAEAAVQLAAVAAERGDVERAQRLLRGAYVEGHPIWAPRAAFELGRLMEDCGDPIDADAAFRRAEALSQPETTPDVHCNLAARWAAMGRDGDAERAYCQVVDAAVTSTDERLREEAAVAAYRLGDLRVQRGDADGAEPSYRFAARSGDEEIAPRAAMAMAMLRADDPTRTQIVDELLELVIDCDHPDYSPAAALELASRRETAGDRAAALDLYDAVRDSEHPEFAKVAAQRIARLLDRGADRYVQDILERAVLRPAFEVDGGRDVGLVPHRRLFDKLAPAMHDLNMYFDLCVRRSISEPGLKVHELVQELITGVGGLIDKRLMGEHPPVADSVTVTITVTPTAPQAFMVECSVAHDRRIEVLMPSFEPRATLTEGWSSADLVSYLPCTSPNRTLVAHGCSDEGNANQISRGGESMATNPPKGDGHRNGAVRGRSQVKAPNGNWVKRDTSTGKFMDQKHDGTPFKGVRREK